MPNPHPILVVLFLAAAPLARANEGALNISTEAVQQESASQKVYAVYGVSAEDYLPDTRNQPLEKRRIRHTSGRQSRGKPFINIPMGFYLVVAAVVVGLVNFLVALFVHDIEREDKVSIKDEIGNLNG
jgi:Flp pilus assembly protein TadB